MAKLDEVLCPNNRILGLMKRIQQALSPRGVTSTTSDDLGDSIRSVDTDAMLEKWDEVILQLKRTHLHLFLLTGFDGIEEDPVLILKPKRHRLLAAAVEDEDLADLLHVREEQPDGTAGGTLTGSTWNVRSLNATSTNEITGSSLGSSQITLPAGTYSLEAYAVSLQTNGNRLRLRDTTGSATLIAGLNTNSPAADSGLTTAAVRGRFTISVESVLELQHWAAATKTTTGAGATINDTDELEVYAEVLIKKIS